jgi:hypothetical protein
MVTSEFIIGFRLGIEMALALIDTCLFCIVMIIWYYNNDKRSIKY